MFCQVRRPQKVSKVVQKWDFQGCKYESTKCEAAWDFQKIIEEEN